MSRIEISPGPAALLSSSESMNKIEFRYKYEFRYIKFIRVFESNTQTFKTPRLENDLFRQLTIFFGSIEISPPSNLISSTLTTLSFGLVYCLMKFHCSSLVGNFWKKLMQKLLCASLSLLLNKFLKRLNSLYVSLSGIFFHILNKKCFCAIEHFNSCVNQGLEFL